MTAPDDATLNQHRAADPAASTWLSANAGSGKTRVLTDRVARLLLAGTPPENILCLTYTTAAAGEMQNRLFRTLGAWAMLDDEALSAALEALGETGPFDLSRARTLFARAIETPGGLKIQTIHSFCAALLRRFPLEAGVSPQFREMDDSAQRQLLSEVLERLAVEDPNAAVSQLAAYLSGDDLIPLARELIRSRLPPAATELDAVVQEYGLARATSEGELIAGLKLDRGLVRRLADVLRTGTKAYVAAAVRLDGLSWTNPGLADVLRLESVLLYGEKAKAPFGSKAGAYPTKDMRTVLSTDIAELDDLMDRVAETRTDRIALSAARRTAALRRFAAALLPAYEAAKQERGLLDFDDLIERTGHLLSERKDAAWVLYRLDGAIDHILVDEAQDTSPAQWRIVDLLSREFSAGEGARDRDRTLFVVGDKKQSIYSFQGADAQKFDEMREAFSTRFAASGHMQSRELLHSFRSSSAILRTVDAVFEGDTGAGLGRDIRHIPFFQGKAGRVDLWPLIPKAEKQEDAPWYLPVDTPSPDNPTRLLANRIADELHRLIKVEKATLPAGKGARPLTEGDILILVRGRTGSGDLFQSLIRALKARDLAVAGADRLKIAAELAVRDLTVLLSFAALPEDDLSLAAALRSPLFGWSEDALFRLAHGRGAVPLWAVLRNDETKADTINILRDLRDQTDYLRPYELLERILVRHDGRRKLLARLGEEARDGIDALLDMALSYERNEVPSLTGFLAWLEGEATEIKRPADAAEGQIQVMTIHGAKGLERPVVILPDTLRGEDRMREEVLKDDAGQPHWRAPAASAPPLHTDLINREKERALLERQRLLYVAMTRAESWLIVCGAGEEKEGTWYEAVRVGLEKEGATQQDFPFGATGLRLETGEWSVASREPASVLRNKSVELPDWALKAANRPEFGVGTLSPSDLGGAKALPDEMGDAGQTEAALRRGRQIHLLLEHLPRWPGADRMRMAQDFLTSGEDLATPDEAAELAKDVLALLKSPDLGPVFEPSALAEVDVTASLPELGGARIHGSIDRLILAPDRVVAVDFKTNRIVPDRAEDTPLGILRQMGAYAAALAQIYPDREVETAILWTCTGTLMPLPHDIVMDALRSTPVS